jgi:hypothetical protein
MAFHDDLAKIIAFAGKWVADSVQISTANLKAITESSKTDKPAIDSVQWQTRTYSTKNSQRLNH